MPVISRRCAHTDVSIPNFDAYRSKSALDSSKAARESEDIRRATPQGIFYGGIYNFLTKSCHFMPNFAYFINYFIIFHLFFFF